MTPPARLAAAIGVLDRYLAGEPVEKALTNWARKSRFAGSKDRAAVRDIVFQCVRCRLSYGANGGTETGRGLAIGYVSEKCEAQYEELFDGSQYGPESLGKEEVKTLNRSGLSSEAHVNMDIPDWLLPDLERAFGDDLTQVANLLRNRAPVWVRVNLSRTSVSDAARDLAKAEIETRPTDLSPRALEITSNPRKLAQSTPYLTGLVELQDAASTAVCDSFGDVTGLKVLDYCAGGGGKALAFADGRARVTAHDIDPRRMRDLPARAVRAKVKIDLVEPQDVAEAGLFDLVLCDAPCSGSGAWRRAPEGKWSLTRARLDELQATQADILNKAQALVAPGGVLGYVTCSLLNCENEDQIEAFLKTNPAWRCVFSRQFSPLDGADGFFVAHLTRVHGAN